jgi:glutathione peroxidase
MKLVSILALSSLMTINMEVVTAQGDFYKFNVTTITDEEFHFSILKGKKVLIVNTASKCGFTPQYEELEKLYREYKDENLVIIGFPANNFLKQEPGSNEEIIQFCRINYGVSFPMMSKINVKGKDIHPLYQWLTKRDLNGVLNSSVKWNFQKYMIDEHGNLTGFASPKTKPYSEKILNWLNN